MPLFEKADRVEFRNSSFFGRVLEIDDNLVLVKYDDSRQVWEEVSNLTMASSDGHQPTPSKNGHLKQDIRNPAQQQGSPKRLCCSRDFSKHHQNNTKVTDLPCQEETSPPVASVSFNHQNQGTQSSTLQFPSSPLASEDCSVQSSSGASGSFSRSPHPSSTSSTSGSASTSTIGSSSTSTSGFIHRRAGSTQQGDPSSKSSRGSTSKRSGTSFASDSCAGSNQEGDSPSEKSGQRFSDGDEDQELQRIKEQYAKRISLFEHLDLSQFVDCFKDTEDDKPLRFGFDADSFVVVTQHFPDIGLMSHSGIHFKRANQNSSPHKVRPRIRKSRKNSRNGGLRPSKGDAVMKNPTPLDRFPSFNIGTVNFDGLDMYLSVHLLMEKAVDQRCSQNIINTWNAVNMWAFHCREDRIVALYKANKLSIELSDITDIVALYRMVASGSYGFAEGGEKDKGIKFDSDMTSTLHIALIWYKLQAIADSRVQLENADSVQLENADANDNSRVQLENADADSARSLYYCSVFLLQGIGFKHIWREKLGDPQSRYCKCDHCPIRAPEECNSWIVAKVQDTHECARNKFFDRNGITYHASTRCAIDIAITIHCKGDWHILPHGKKAQVTITQAAKTRQTNNHIEEDESVCDDDDDWEEEEVNLDEGDESDSDDDWEEEEVNRDEWEEEEGEDEEIDSCRLLDLETVAASQARIRYPKMMTTFLGDSQIKHGALDMTATVEENDGKIQRVTIHHVVRNRKAAPIIQLYLPNYRFLFRDQVIGDFWKEARALPRTLLRMASEFERSLVEEAFGEERGKFQKHVKRLFDLAERFVSEGIVKENFHGRYEMTFETFPNDVACIEPPVTTSLSPLNCIAFVKRHDLATKMLDMIQMHKEPIERFMNLMNHHDRRVVQMTRRGEWAALVALMESMVLMCGQGGHGQGTLLKASLDKERQSRFYDNHFWMISPSFLRKPENVPHPTPLNLPFEVDPTLIFVACSPLGPVPENGPAGIAMISGLLLEQKQLSAAVLQGLPKLRHASEIRATCKLMYQSFLAASKGTESANEVGEAEEVEWKHIGQDPSSTEILFEHLATILLAYHKFEASNRLVTRLQKVLKASPDTGTTARQILKVHWNVMTKGLEAVWTYEQFCNWRAALEERYAIPFPEDKCTLRREDKDRVGSADEIFVLITGMVMDQLGAPKSNGSATDTGNAVRAWEMAGYPFLLRYLKTLVDKLVDPPDITKQAFGGRNPFKDSAVFKHCLAAAVAATVQVQNTANNPPFLWHTVPSRLEASWKMREVIYNVRAGTIAIRNESALPISGLPSGEPKKDMFISAFLKPKHCHYSLQLASELGQELIPESHDVTDIFLLQAAIFWICKNQGSAAKCSKDIIAKIAIAPSLWSKNDKSDIGRKFCRPPFNMALRKLVMRGQTSSDFEQLYGFLEALGDRGKKLDRSLFDKATRQLKPLEAVGNATSLCDAWIALDDMGDESSKLIEIQRKALNDKQYRIALGVYSSYGIASRELFRHIQDSRVLVQDHVRRIRAPDLTATEKATRTEAAATEFSRFSVNSVSFGCWMI